ncbi:MAG: TolC family protein [Planctomycetaceae bacterium]
MVVIGATLMLLARPAVAQLGVDEQHTMQFALPEAYSRMHRLPSPAPVTVATPDVVSLESYLALDDAIRIALQHSEVVRVLTGQSASSSGSTIYDTAIATAAVDQSVAAFDPVFSANSIFRHNDLPTAATDPGDPLNAVIFGNQSGGTDLSAALSRKNRLGGVGEFKAIDNWTHNGRGGPLDSTHSPQLELSYTQPLLAGFGRPANEAPIVIAHLKQQQSYFQFKSSVQQLVQGVITAYWSLVQARTELWAREKQVEQAQQAYDLVAAKLRTGLGNLADVSQPKSALANFRASLLAARANVIQSEAALRNLLGLPPEDGHRLVPSTPPTRDRVQFHWEDLVRTAQSQRPDLVELNLVLMADQQTLVLRDNNARPTFNAQAIQRWNGLSGRALNGATVSSGPDQHNDWSLGFNFSVPLGLRSARASLRTAELQIAKDRAFIRQSLHQMEHELATSVRTLDSNFLQYEAFRESRQAARENLEVQLVQERLGRSIFLNVLQAITDWGTAVTSEARSLTAYNSQLASLEQSTGTILETHGIYFVQEQYGSIGAWGRCFEDDCYPESLRPAENLRRYPDSGKAAEQSFDLDNYPRRNPNAERLHLPEKPVDLPPDSPDSSALMNQVSPVTDQNTADRVTPSRSRFGFSSLRRLLPGKNGSH